MKRIRYVTAAAVVVVIAVALSPVMRSYSSYAKWGTLTVPFYVNPANADVSLSAATAALQAGMNVWNTQSGTPFRFSYAGQTNNTVSDYDNRNVILFRSGTNGGAIATTYSWWNLNGILVDSDIVFWDGSRKFFTGSSGCVSGAYVEDVAAHELGHAMGLSHSSVSDATMNASYGTCSLAKRTLASDDIAGAKKLYGTSGTSSASSTTNTTPTVSISGPANGVTVTAGASITFTGSASDTQQGNLTSQLVWRSNLAGQIGTGGSFTRTLTAGTHAITATVTDSGGLTGQRAVTVYSTTATLVTVSLWGSDRISSSGVRYARLGWSGFTSSNVDVYRNGAKVSTTVNDGLTFDYPVPAWGTYVYKVCAAGTSTCTNQLSVTLS